MWRPACCHAMSVGLAVLASLLSTCSTTQGVSFIREVPVTDGFCFWSASGRAITLVGDTASCEACRRGCEVHPTCTLFRWGGNDAITYSNATLCTAISCFWWASNNGTRALPLTGDTSSCESCRLGCERHPTCLTYRWSSSLVVSYTNANICPAAPRSPPPRPPSPAPSPGAGCVWLVRNAQLPVPSNITDCEACHQGCATHPTCLQYRWNGSPAASYQIAVPCGGCSWWAQGQPLVLNGDVSTCESCRSGCAVHPTCTTFSQGGSQPTSYNNASVCTNGAGTSPSPASDNCTWWVGSTQLPVTGDTSGCEACRIGCQLNPTCTELQWRGGPRTSYENATACNSTTVCLWAAGAETLPLYGNPSTCEACRYGCEQHPTCTVLIWGAGGSWTSYTNLSMCGVPPSPPPPFSPAASRCSWRDDNGELQVDGNPQTCAACQSGCQFNPTCREYRYGSQQPDWISYANVCPSTGAGQCEWQANGRSITVTGSPQTCVACQQGCAVDTSCTTYRFGAQQPTWTSYTSQCSSPSSPVPSPARVPSPPASRCAWRANGQDMVVPANASLSCSACQRGCHDDQYCNSYRWGSSAWTVYTATCPTSSPSASGAGCVWASNGQAEATQGATSSCQACRLGCLLDSSCTHFSFNSSPAASYSDTTACPASNTCVWENNSRTLPVTGDTSTCNTCRMGCQVDASCTQFSYAGSSLTSYTDSSPCNESKK